MDCNPFAHLSAFRLELYACFCTAGDALFNCIDALLSETPARSLAELSLSPFFARKWPSLYQGLQEASVDRVALQRVFAAYVALPSAGQRLVLGIDASSIARPCSSTAKDRTYVHQSNLPEGSKPVRPGWQFSTLTVLPPSRAVGRIFWTMYGFRANKPKAKPPQSSWAPCCPFCPAALCSWETATMVA